MITLTDSAANAVNRFIESSGKDVLGLRIKIEGGGCSGFQYAMRLESTLDPEDELIECAGVNMVLDTASKDLLNGVTVDFVETLDGSGFKFENPNATASCGCGKSFTC